jgi:integrase
MPAIPHVVRRSAIYYWRRRVPAPLAKSRGSATLILGLRTSDPRRARVLAGQITALVDLHFFPAIMNQRLSHKQIQQIFREVFTRHLDKLDAVVARERMEPDFDAEASRRSDRVVGWAYRLLETRGAAANVDLRAQQAMRADGMSEADMGEVAAMLGTMQRQKTAAEQPGRLQAAVERAGGEPSSMNLALAQEVIYRAMAEANFQTERRYDGVRSETPFRIDEILRSRIAEAADDAPMKPVTIDPTAEKRQPHPVAMTPLGETKAASAVPLPVVAAATAAVAGVDAFRPQSAPPKAATVPSRKSYATKNAAITLDEHPFVASGEKLIKKNERSGDWDEKTQRQARQIYRLFAKLLVEQSLVDLAELRQSHFGALDDLLASVAKSYGKSPKDELRTTAQLRAIGASKPEGERGIAPETLNRHLTFLGQLLAFLKGQGVALDRDIDLSLLRGKTRNSRGRQKRALFSGVDLAAIFRLPCFTGCAGWKDSQSFTPGPKLYHRGLYFAIILLYYTGARREEVCGLMVDDVQIAKAEVGGEERLTPCICINRNDERRIKNVQSVRLVALTSEIVRLGFLDYVAEIRALGYTLVFPDLKSPTSRSPMGDRLYDEFVRGLEMAIPSASSRKKVLHSFRKTFGDSLKQAGISAEIRGDILGHGGETVTEEIYCDPIALTAMLEHMSKVPIVTAHLERRTIQLIPWVEQKEKPPFSRKSRQKW